MSKLFKPSGSKNNGWNLTKTFIQTALFWGTFLILVPWGICSLESSNNISRFAFYGQAFLASSGFVICSMLGVWSAITMAIIGKGTPLPTDGPQKLVIKGPYRLVRNPMAVAGIMQGICVGVFLGSWIVIVYSISGVIVWHLFVRPAEEKDLEVRFKEDYVKYKAKVRCWIPKIKV
ncbi:MAG: protein-S-isoprenylcysteine O-methyltransferase Ste14 [Parvicellaceae bacterium]